MKKAAQKKVAKKRVKLARGRTPTPAQAKAPKASTIRLKPELQTALDRISDHLDRPKNKLVNQAVAEFLEKTSYQLREDIEDILINLRAYRAKDPNYEAQIERFAAAEASHVAEDAHEGSLQHDSAQSLSKEIQEMIDA